MKFLFLGTGTSAGVPAIGCGCAVCTSADPRDQRLRTAAAVQWVDARGQERTVLIDAGPDLRQQALRAGLSRCDAVVFTHNHVDHTFGLDEVRRFNAVMGTPIDIYGDRHTLEHLHRVYRHIFDRQGNVNDSFVATLIEHRVEAGAAFELYGARFTPVPLLHGKLPVLGYRIDCGLRSAERGTGSAEGDAGEVGPERVASPFPLAYCTDVSGVPPESWKLLKGVRTLVLDALRHRKHPTHFTLGQAVSVAQQVGAERTYFVHMAHDLPHEETNAELPEGMELAYDGLTLGELAGLKPAVLQREAGQDPDRTE